MKGHKIINLAKPNDDTDAVNEKYVDSTVNSYDKFKEYLKGKSEMGIWSGSLNGDGSSVKVIFDTSKAELFTIEFRIIRRNFKETRTISQNEHIIFTPWFDVLLNKTYSITISLSKNIMKIEGIYE